MNKSIHLYILISIFASFLFNACTSKRPLNETKKPNKERSIRNAMILEAKKYLGVKYMYGGASPSGFDCSGFTHFVYKKQNITLSRSSTEQSKQGKEISIASSRAGDLLFFGRNGRNGKIQHVGMVIVNENGKLNMIHASSSKGISIVDVNTSSYWKPKLLFCKRIL